MAGVVSLPCSKRWVCGLAVHDGRPIPVLDPVVDVGSVSVRPQAGVLLGHPDQAAFAMILADGLGRFTVVPAEARLSHATGWLVRIQGCEQSVWWLEASRLAEKLKE